MSAVVTDVQKLPSFLHALCVVHEVPSYGCQFYRKSLLTLSSIDRENHILSENFVPLVAAVFFYFSSLVDDAQFIALHLR